MGNESITRAFDKAGLRINVLEGDTGPDRVASLQNRIPVFAMGIDHPNTGDRFWMRPNDAQVQVLGRDRDMGQLVLFVREEARYFTERFRKSSLLSFDRRLADIVGEDETHIWVRRKTTDEKRHFLVGHDERPRHYFIAQLPSPATTVRDAHEVLRNPRVEGVKGKVTRQGEWFFVEPSSAELESIAQAFEKKAAVYGTKAPIGPVFHTGSFNGRVGGNPHTADEVVVISRRDAKTNVIVGNDVFVRGKIRHREHDTVEFKSWRKVLRNTERVESTRGIAVMRGVSWVD